MGFPTAELSAGNYTSIRRNAHKSIQYISLLPNTVIQTTTLATAVGSLTGETYGQLTLSATVDADVEIGHTVLVSTSATVFSGMNIKAIFRVRRTPSGTTLYINEASQNILAGTYIHILDDYRIQPKLGRITSAGTYFKDYDWTFGLPRPLINGIQSAYAGFINGSSVLQISFTPTGVPIHYGATISSWSWDVADGTITVGTASTQNITVTFPEGFRWITVTVTDSNGRTGWRRIPIWAHGDTFTPATGFNGATITGSWDAGYSASVSAFDGIDDYIDETLCVIWRREWYGDTEEHIVNNIDFVGRLRNETLRVSGDSEQGTRREDVDFNIEGPGQQLQRILGPVISTIDSAVTTPTIWDRIYWNTPARTIAHILKEHSTFCELHDLAFETRMGDDYRFLIFGTTQSDMLAVVNDIAQGIQNGHLEFAPDGASRAVPDCRNLITTSPSPIRWMQLTEDDLLSANVTYDHIKKYGKAELSGAIYNPTSRTITPWLMTVPGALETSGYQIGRLDRQILNNTLGFSSGDTQLHLMGQRYYNVLNSRFTLSATLPDGYHFIIPSKFIQYRIDLGPDTNDRGFEIQYGGWLCRSVTITQDNAAGTRDVSAEFVEYLVNTAAAAEPDEIDYSQEEIGLPVTDVQQDGNTVVVWSDDIVWITTNFKITDSPTWHNITPTLGANETIKQCAWSYSTPRLYMLTYDSSSTESRVWYKTNGHDIYEVWKDGAAVTGQYTVLRATHEDQHLYIYARAVSGNAVTRFSDDSGQTLSSAQTVGANASVTGFDTIRIGTVTLAGYAGNVGRSTTEAGTYSLYSSGFTFAPACLHIPRYAFGSTTTDNINTTTPEYLAANYNQVRKVTASGATITNITPTLGTPPVYTSTNHVVMPWTDGNKIAAVFIFNVPPNHIGRLYRSSNAGASWSVDSTQSIGGGNTFLKTPYIRMRRTDAFAKELYITSNGDIFFSPDFGETTREIVSPVVNNDSDSVIGIEVYG